MNKNNIKDRYASLKMLQIRGALMLGLLVAQFVIGMTLDVFIRIPEMHPGVSGAYLTRTIDGYGWAMTNGGGVGLTAHLVIATILVLGSVATLGFSIAARNKVWIIASSCGLIGVWLAFLNGLEFINTNLDKHSFAMAMAFMIALISYGSGLYLAKQ